MRLHHIFAIAGLLGTVACGSSDDDPPSDAGFRPTDGGAAMNEDAATGAPNCTIRAEQPVRSQPGVITAVGRIECDRDAQVSVETCLQVAAAGGSDFDTPGSCLSATESGVRQLETRSEVGCFAPRAYRSVVTGSVNGQPLSEQMSSGVDLPCQ